ncbi:transposable element Tcb1 transposase [Trichonephila clavipes]|uniref:Transposable element Tcb1 transposase n=1 Tax=Trichonephila clavipes TaxID=2585209 RepID=A0A8X6S0C7_TRICX|nr:transposable element Tcb1 transposase [Trichonephila clavipes]
MNGGHGQWNGTTLSLLTNPASACNITIVGFESGDTMNCSVMYRHTWPAPVIMVWNGIEFHCHTPLVRIADILNSQCYISEALEPIVLPYIQRLPSAVFQ